MNPGTAAHRLRMDILFDLVIRAGYVCHQCGKELDRDSFSIEHKEAWLDSSDPRAKFFDLSNIAFSHMVCNLKAARKPNKIHIDIQQRKAAQWVRRVQRTPYCPIKRRARYEKYGH